MFNNRLIKNLQNRTEVFKHVVMWSGIFFIMSVIFTFWLINFPSQIPTSENNEAADNLKKELPSIWQALKEQVNSLNNLKDMWAIPQ